MSDKKDFAEILVYLNTGANIYNQLKEAGSLDEFYNEVGNTYTRLRRYLARVDIEVLKMYQEAGLNMEQAVSLMLANKTNTQEFFKTTFAQKTKKK